jgi:hypothetical protein
MTKEEECQHQKEEIDRKKRETQEREELQKGVTIEADKFTHVLHKDVITQNFQYHGETMTSLNNEETILQQLLNPL